jgi:hypothetical protein
MLIVGAAIALPLGAMANDVTTPEDCATSGAPGYVYQMGNADGRGSFCVSDGDASNGNELYIGGDATQPCGHVEVAGQVLNDESGQGEGFCH